MERVAALDADARLPAVRAGIDDIPPGSSGIAVWQAVLRNVLNSTARATAAPPLRGAEFFAAFEHRELSEHAAGEVKRRRHGDAPTTQSSPSPWQA